MTCNTSDQRTNAAPIVVVHTVLRREFGLAAGLVRGVADRDRRRAGVVAAHLQLLLRGLEHHHTLEDEQLWPRLAARVAPTGATTVRLMEMQHARITAQVEQLVEAVPAWERTAAHGDGAELARLLDHLHAELMEHLDAEERDLLPLAEQHISADEWNEIGRVAEEGTQPRERALVFGMFQYEGDPVVVASMLRTAPLPVRLLVPVLARRAFRRHALAVHGTATP